LSHYAQSRGARVAWGWGWPGEGAPGYWPWVQVLRSLGLDGTRQSGNAALRGFEKRGWIELRDRVVTVKQAAALRRFAGS
jgi:hypothetical protein